MSRVSSFISFTGLSETELQRRLASTPTTTAASRLTTLSALDAALVQGLPQATTQDAFAALSATTREAHGLEDPLHAFANDTATAGFAAGAPVSPSAAALDAAGKMGVARVSGLVTGFADAATEASTTTTDTDTIDATDATETTSTDSSNIEFEQLKNEMNKLSQMQTAMSNVMTAMHTSAMAIIGNIKG